MVSVSSLVFRLKKSDRDLAGGVGSANLGIQQAKKGEDYASPHRPTLVFSYYFQQHCGFRFNSCFMRTVMH